MPAMNTVRIRVRLYGILTELAGAKELMIELPQSATLGSVLDKVFSLYPKVREFADKYEITILHNSVPATRQDDIKLSNNDRVELLPPSAGG